MEDRTRKRLYLIFAIIAFFALFNLIVLPLALNGIDNESTFGRFYIIYYLFFLPFLLSASVVTLISLKLNRKILTIFSLIGFIIGYLMYFLTQWLPSGGFTNLISGLMYVSLILLWPFSFLFPSSGDGGMIVWVFTPATLSFICGVIGSYISFLIRKHRKK